MQSLCCQQQIGGGFFPKKSAENACFNGVQGNLCEVVRDRGVDVLVVMVLLVPTRARCKPTQILPRAHHPMAGQHQQGHCAIQASKVSIECVLARS
jgi:hypothetical protein